MRFSVVVPLSLILSLILFLGACANAPVPPEEGNPDRADLSFASLIQVGDIILTNNKSGSGCAYLNVVDNFFTFFTYCHAMLVVERHGTQGLDTIEALGPGLGVHLMENRHWFLDEYSHKAIAILRVQDEDGNDLSPEKIEQVIRRSHEFTKTHYEEPPVDIDGDPLETGIYCSMLPYRAYLDTVGIDLDGIFPFVITPDELYNSDFTRVVFESVPEEEDDDDWDDNWDDEDY